MPIPKPNKGEKEKDFLDRCMGDEVMVREFPDADQRYKVCQRQLSLSAGPAAGKVLFARNDAGMLLFAEEVRRIDDGASWNMILPIGSFFTRKYGDIEITQGMAEDLVRNWNDKVMSEREPFVDTEHDLGPANGWILELEVRTEGTQPGVYALIDWTDRGRELVEKKIYRYLSALIGEHKQVATGKTFKNVFLAVSLTNTPLMETMPAVSLDDKGEQDAGGAEGDRGQNDAGKNPRGGKIMDFKELLTAIPELKLSDNEKKEIGKLLGIEQAPVQAAAGASGEADGKQMLELSTKVSALETANKSLTETVTRLNTELQTRDENDIITRALSEGRMLPADESKWREDYRKAPAVVGPIIEKLPKVMDFSTKGSGAGGKEGELEFSAEDAEAAEAAGMSKDEYLEALGRKKPAATGTK